MGEIITTSIKIDSDLWKKAKIEAVTREITVSELLAQAITNEIKRK
ncbi:MAG: hypothetical protein K5798_02555 [Nitrosopumilus sp.]|nr:hypothetical protein [Nitrosopumilus sp.]MCV0366131.1 hypothetical protein [Nitrosopumilus sp.]